ncbi:mitochondrial enolase superfamily member 1 [Grus japonensis]|uniref:Mitochondrial enolase superfamily member 1 n=1 Tax=Grus japonensis TaxID=30415 RepID=A0ABC9VZ79_GRUJA
MPAGSKTGPPLAKAKPISASVITYLRRRKTLRERAFAARERSEKITVGHQALGTEVQADANTDSPSVKGELLCELLQELDPYKLMDPDNIHLRVLRELADIVRPLSIILEKSWRAGDIPEDWKKANVTPCLQEGLKGGSHKL